MIDTDEYEGHTPGPWKHFYSVAGEACEIISEKNGVVGRWQNKSDGRLMADAPLLLAEVKRLREELYQYEKYSICHPDTTHCCDECLERNGFEVKKNE